MNKQQVLNFLQKNGITELCLINKSIPKQWILEYLFEEYKGKQDMIDYYVEFIDFHFKNYKN